MSCQKPGPHPKMAWPKSHEMELLPYGLKAASLTDMPTSNKPSRCHLSFSDNLGILLSTFTFPWSTSNASWIWMTSISTCFNCHLLTTSVIVFFFKPYCLNTKRWSRLSWQTEMHSLNKDYHINKNYCNFYLGGIFRKIVTVTKKFGRFQ